MRVSVVIPFYQAERFLAACLRALASQSLPRSEFEVIAVDDGSTDGGGAHAEAAGVRLIRQQNRGAPAARNTGVAAASGTWIAFTDADCVPSRGWLRALLAAVEGDAAGGAANGAGGASRSNGETAGAAEPVLGAAGGIIGHGSDTPAARFVDLSGALDAERHLSHPVFPFAPTGNAMYRRSAIEAVGGFDDRLASYDSCDLHRRLLAEVGGEYYFVPSAIVLHTHRSSWPEYWRQQRNYGRGLAQFYLKHRSAVPWSALREAGSWAAVGAAALGACRPGSADEHLVRRGGVVKDLAQRVGFAATYFDPRERERWKAEG